MAAKNAWQNRFDSFIDGQYQSLDKKVKIFALLLAIAIPPLCAISMRDFARPDANGMNTKGLYRYSHNPMYVAYFVCFLGIAFLTKSMIFFLILVIFQTAAHWIILSEERWCLEKFGKSYQDYQDKVRRYF